MVTPRTAHAALVSLCQKVVNTKRTSSGLCTQFLKSLCQESADTKSMHWTFWTVHTLPGNLHLKSAERASSSTWLSGQTTVYTGYRGETINEEDIGRTLVSTQPLEALCREVQTGVAKVWDATALDP